MSGKVNILYIRLLNLEDKKMHIFIQFLHFEFETRCFETWYFFTSPRL